MHTVLERGRDAHRKPCAHFYCVPALFACIPTTFPTQSHHSRLDKVFIEMHPRYLTAVLVIHFKQNSHQEVCFMKQNMHTPCFMSCFILALTLFLVLTLFLAFTHVCILILLIQALFWLHLHTFAFLLYSSTFLVAFTQCSGSNSFKNKRHGPIRNPFDKTSCRFSHFGIHVPFNFYHFNTNFSLPVLLKV